MKTKLLFLTMFFLFSIISTNSFGSAADAPDAVLDIDGKKLRTDAYYYILPANVRHRGRGGGVTLGSTGNESCPVGVLEELYNFNDGLPVKFYPINPKNGVVRVSIDLNIQFSIPEMCGQSTVWSLDGYDESIGREFVGIGGVRDYPSHITLSNWFRIEKFGDDYKLFYCPTAICNYCGIACNDVSTYDQNGRRRLSLGNGSAPFKIVFKKMA